MSEKASFAAAASQLWNQNKSTLGTKSFNISLTNDKDKSEIKSTSDVSANRTTGHVFGSGIFSKAGQTDKKDNGPPSASQIFQAFAAKKSEGFNSNASTSGDWLNAEKSGEKKLSQGESKVTEKPKTGEEDETNIFSAACKFFQYDVEDKRWKEKGPGTLRLNEPNGFDTSGSRLVARSSGTQKVLLNSLLFPEMVFESVSEKRIKISAHTPDSDLPQLFLIQSTPSIIGQLTSLLRQRIKEETQAVVAVLPKKRKNDDGDTDSINEKTKKLNTGDDSDDGEQNDNDDSIASSASE